MLIGRDEKAQALVHPKSQIKKSIKVNIQDIIKLKLLAGNVYFDNKVF